MKTLTFIRTLLTSLAMIACSGAALAQGQFSPGYYICESMGGDTSYFSDIFLGPGDMAVVTEAFKQMLAAKYGYTNRVTCPLAFKTAATLKQMQDQHKPYTAQRAQQGRKIVETGWTYGGAPSLSAGSPHTEPANGNTAELPPAYGGVPSALTPDAQSAYERAVEAQRPRSVSQAQLASAAKIPAPDPNHASTTQTTRVMPSPPSNGTTAWEYTFCSSTGSPYRGTAPSHYYITGIFPVTTANAHPEGAFGRYLRTQHPQEQHNTNCVPPGPIGTVENSRRMNMENNRKSFPDRTIVELPWKPTS